MTEIEILTAMSEKLEQIEFYAAVSAVAVCLTMGLVLWRLVVLSKNQRKIF